MTRKGTAEEETGGATAEVSVTGKGETVVEALKKAGLKEPAKDLRSNFGELLKEPTNKIICNRVLPRTVKDPATGKLRECDDMVELPPPMTRDEIVHHLREEFGGKKWNIRVVDDGGEVLGAQNIDVPGEPKVKPQAADDFEIPDDVDFGDEGPKEEHDPLGDEIEEKAKQTKSLQLERQNSILRKEIEDLKGGGNGKVDVQAAIEKALKESDERHRREMEGLKRDKEKDEMERRLSDSAKAQFDGLKALIEKNGSSKESESSSTSRELLHRMEMMQKDNSQSVKDAMAAVEKAASAQVSALERTVDARFTALQTSLTQLTSRPHDNPIKDIVPLLTSSIDRSTSGYKEIIGPLMAHVSRKPEEVERGDSLLETVQTLQAIGVIPGQNKDFTNRVMDLMDKAAPEVFELIKKKQEKGEELTKEAIKNHLKLTAQKISDEVSAAAAKEIRQIASQRGLPAPSGAAATATAPAPAKSAAPAPAAPKAPSPVGRLTPEEVAARQRVERPAPAAPLPAPAPAPKPVLRAVPPVEPEPEAEEPEEEEEEGEPMTVEEEMADRVNATLETLHREMKIRPREITWPKFAWDTLPGSVLDQVIFSNDDEDVYNAVKPLADEELCNSIWELIRSDAKAKEFIVAGINIIKAWAVELQEKARQAAEASRAAAEEAAPPAE